MKKLLISLLLATGLFGAPSTPINNLVVQNAGVAVPTSRVLYQTTTTTGSANLTFTDGTTTGQLIHPVGAVGTPSMTFFGRTTNGLYSPAANTVDMAINGAVNARFVTTHLLLGGLTTDGTGVLQFLEATTSAGGITMGADTNIFRQSGGQLALNGEGTANVGFNLYLNSARKAYYFFDGTNFQVSAETGSLILKSSDTTALTLDSSQNATFAGFVSAAAASDIKWTGRTKMVSTADGLLALTNNAATDFSRLQFGGATSSFPALKRNGTRLETVLADDSAAAPFKAGRFDSETNTLSGAGAVSVLTGVTLVTTTGVAQALTLADGSVGQTKTIIHDVDGGSAILTPTTKTGFSTVTFTNAGETVTLMFTSGRGWVVISSYLAVVAP